MPERRDEASPLAVACLLLYNKSKDGEWKIK